MKILKSGLISVAFVAFCFWLFHAVSDKAPHATVPEVHDIGEQEDEEPGNYDRLFKIIHEASMEYWIADAIRRGKSVGEAFEEADRIDSALHPDAPNIDIERSYGTEGWTHWQAYKEAWGKSHADVAAYRKAMRADWEVEHKARQAAFKAAFGILAKELRDCCREEHHETAN